MAAAQDVEEGRARVEPDVEDVVALGVVRRREIARRRRARLRRVSRDHASTPPSATICRRAVDQRQRVGMQLARHLVQEERQRHAPVALPADAPVGPVRDHVVQPGAAVLRIEVGRVDGVERALAQGLRRRVDRRTRRASTRRPRPCARTTAPRRGRRPASCGASSADSCARGSSWRAGGRRRAARRRSSACAFQMCWPPNSGSASS